jgi:RepB DNA-primase N-terminal domain
MTAQFYRMHDAEPRGVFPIEPYLAADWNRRGNGIFWTVNRFKTAERRIENLERIEAWAVDMDEGTKAEMLARLEKSLLIPTLIVETKRGYQAYWRAKDARPEHWNAIVLDRLVPFYGADKNARDLARILRVPGFLHLKNPAEPFKVRTVHTHPVAYTEMQAVAAYPAPHSEAKNEAAHAAVKREVKFAGSDDFWDRVYHLDCEEGLARLSGTREVGGEQFTFRRTASGTLNILVDGKGTSCWVDRSGRIGSLSKGGPTLYQWLTHSDYGNGPKEAVDAIKRAFPQLDPVKR